MNHPASKSKLLLTTIFLLGIVGIFWTFLSDFGIGESGYNFLGKTKKVTLSPGMPVSQTFTAHENGLHQVRVVLGNASIRRGEHIGFQLKDEACDTEIASISFSGEPGKQGAYTVFPFESISDSMGKRYCFVATYFSDENRKGGKPYLSATDAPDPAFSDRTLVDSNKGKTYESHSLFLRPAYTEGSLRADLGTLLDRLSQYKPGFLKGWPIAALFTILVVGSIALGIRIIRL
ncbi:MAG: hypothetical protein KBD19_00425 [Candidatus Moranbacteria bacterium]|nr:hypothetical protein [Candidatus Moranbacteria bacterium]